MSTSTRARGSRANKRTSLVGLFKVMTRLTPRQVADEFSLALTQMKQKGIQAGIAVAFFVVALIFLAFLAVALIVAAIAGLSNVMEPWLAALAVGGLFLVILVILALIGLSKLKKALPLLPEDAIRGVRHDIGVLKEGKSFDESTLDEKPEKKRKTDDKKKEKDAKKSAPAPSIGALKSRTRERREHMAAVRDGLGRELDPKARKAALKRSAASSVDNVKAHLASSGSGSHRSGSDARSPMRWKPLVVLAVSVGAMAVMARRLLQK